MRNAIINLGLFQLAWFACVLGGAQGLGWLGVAVAAAVVGIHLWRSETPRSEALLIVAVATIGTLWDGLLVRFGFLEYPSGTPLPWLPPIWIAAMWASFATTLNGGLSWLKGRWGLASAFGAIGGPLAFYAGHGLGAVAFPDPVVAMAVLAGGWSFLMPLLLWLNLMIAPVRADVRSVGIPIEAAEESPRV
jgi:hypothetical protein